MRPRSDPPKMKNSNVVRSRLIILIIEEINKANWMVSNSAKLDRRTKQHTQFGVSASNGSTDMARTKSWRKKRKKKTNKANWMVNNSAQRDRFLVALLGTEEPSPDDEKLYAGQNRGGKKKKK